MPGFDAIGVVVAHIDGALAFYRLLGLDLPVDAGGAGDPYAALG